MGACFLKRILKCLAGDQFGSFGEAPLRAHFFFDRAMIKFKLCRRAHYS